MKKLKIGLGLLMPVAIVICGLISCEKIIDISIPEKERKIVVNGLINPDKNVRVNLSQSISVLEKDTVIPIVGGDVNLYHGTDLIGKLSEESGGFYSLPDFKPQIGQSYRLTATGNGLKSVEATAVLPPLVPFISVDTATLINQWGGRELRLAIKFKDPANVKNVYGFGVDLTTKEFDYSTMSYTGRKLTNTAYLYANADKLLQDETHYFEGKLFFDDLLFDGLTKTVELSVSDYSLFESDTIWVEVRMEQIDPSYYLYAVSNEAYQGAHGNPFSEPVQVYTNVSGGYGIFAGSSAARFPLVILGKRKF